MRKQKFNFRIKVLVFILGFRYWPEYHKKKFNFSKSEIYNFRWSWSVHGPLYCIKKNIFRKKIYYLFEACDKDSMIVFLVDNFKFFIGYRLKFDESPIFICLIFFFIYLLF